MAIREVDSFAGPRPAELRLLANRGVNGIDGQVSAALGAAAAHGRPTVLWCGDLTLLHDVSGLLAGRLHGGNLTVVVSNDDGGGIFVIIPAYNEEKSIKSIVNSCQLLGFNDIIVADDGSTDATGRVAREAVATVVSHIINRGVGAATQTGLQAARLLGADAAVTIDADGQHTPRDITKLINTPMATKSDIVIGSRFMNHENRIPVVRRVFNRIANVITFFLAGVMLTDSQSGLKVFSRKALETIRINTNGFEFSSEIIPSSA